MKLNLLLPSENSHKVGCVCINKLTIWHLCPSIQKTTRWSLETILLKLLQSVRFYVLPECANYFGPAFFLDRGSKHSLKLGWKPVLFWLMIREKQNTTNNWLCLKIFSLNSHTVILVSILKFSFDPIDWLVLTFISRELNFDPFKKRKESEVVRV